jgi:hypothetical protein
VLAKEKQGATPGPAPMPEGAPSDATEAEERKSFVCRLCEQEITDGGRMFCMRAASPIQVFPNPFGHMRVIITFKDARNVRVTGDPTGDFTWFANYTWRVVYCATCGNHLGWLFEGDQDPKSFFALLRDELIERTERST